MALLSLPNLAQCIALELDIEGLLEEKVGGTKSPSTSFHNLMMLPCDCHVLKQNFTCDLGTSHLEGK